MVGSIKLFPPGCTYETRSAASDSAQHTGPLTQTASKTSWEMVHPAQAMQLQMRSSRCTYGPDQALVDQGLQRLPAVLPPASWRHILAAQLRPAGRVVQQEQVHILHGQAAEGLCELHPWHTRSSALLQDAITAPCGITAHADNTTAQTHVKAPPGCPGTQCAAATAQAPSSTQRATSAPRKSFACRVHGRTRSRLNDSAKGTRIPAVDPRTCIMAAS